MGAKAKGTARSVWGAVRPLSTLLTVVSLLLLSFSGSAQAQEDSGPSGAASTDPQGWDTSDASPFVCPILYTHEVPSGPDLGVTVHALQAAGFQPTHMTAMEDALAGRGPVPAGCLVLTFDDALESQYQNAVPELQALGVPATFFFLPDFADGVHSYMTETQEAAIAADGFDVGAHTCHHADLPQLAATSFGAMEAEVIDCKHVIESEIGVPTPYFAYPNGDFNHDVWTTVASAGYRLAFSTEQAKTMRVSDRWYLPRITYTPGETTALLTRIQNAP